jgi:hypothetical protein
MKIKNLRVANAILVGNKTETYFMSDRYEMTLEGVLIWIECKHTGHKVFTSLFNVPYGEAELDAQSKDSVEGNSKKKGKAA